MRITPRGMCNLAASGAQEVMSRTSFQSARLRSVFLFPSKYCEHRFIEYK